MQAQPAVPGTGWSRELYFGALFTTYRYIVLQFAQARDRSRAIEESACLRTREKNIYSVMPLGFAPGG